MESVRLAVWRLFGSERIPDDEQVTIRVDQGTQYISKKFREEISRMGIRIEYCGINSPNEKPHIESFFAQYKREEAYRNEYRCFGDAAWGWQEYRDWYNTERIHQGLRWKTIVDFRSQTQVQDSHLAA